MIQRPGFAGLTALSLALVFLTGRSRATLSRAVRATTSDDGTSMGCIPRLYGDGDCDLFNDNEDCGYDGGDCCECTCVSTDDYTCGENGGYFCLDQNAECVEDDDATFLSNAPDDCIFDFVADGDCDDDNNNFACGYDGGDCCECTCVSTEGYSCGGISGFDCVDPASPCANGYIEAGSKTTVRVSANAFDERPGLERGEHGCLEDGCGPELTRDGIVAAHAESRWSCQPKLVPDGGQCWIEFRFEEPQDIMTVEVAFFKGEHRSRTIEATIDDKVTGTCESYPGSTFNTFNFKVGEAHTVRLTSVGLGEHDWISFLEVRFLVKP